MGLITKTIVTYKGQNIKFSTAKCHFEGFQAVVTELREIVKGLAVFSDNNYAVATKVLNYFGSPVEVRCESFAMFNKIVSKSEV